jgi:hypothetical protein
LDDRSMNNKLNNWNFEQNWNDRQNFRNCFVQLRWFVFWFCWTLVFCDICETIKLLSTAFKSTDCKRDHILLWFWKTKRNPEFWRF